MPNDPKRDIAQILREVLDYVGKSSRACNQMFPEEYDLSYWLVFNVHVLLNFQWWLLVSPSQRESLLLENKKITSPTP